MRRLWNRGFSIAQVGFCSTLLSCSPGSSGSRSNSSCVAGAPIACACSDNRTLTTVCLADSSGYAPCPCGVQGMAGALAVAQGGAGGMSAPQATGAGGAPPIAGAGGGASSGGRAAGAGGAFGAAGTIGSGGATAGKGGSTSSAGTTGAGGSGTGIDMTELEMLRQTCVDEINMYRATLSLKPLKRASAAQETCSDSGAQMDGDSGVAHGSARAGLCRSVGLGAEDTCPGWGVGARTGNATIADALKACLMSMWAEGMPPVSRDACVMDSSGCFQKYGHYLNMSDPNAGAVACSFYHMKTGEYWMNQDFAY